MYIFPSYCNYDDDPGLKRDAEWAQYENDTETKRDAERVRYEKVPQMK